MILVAINSLLHFFNTSSVQALSARTLFQELKKSFFSNSYLHRRNTMDRDIAQDRTERGEVTKNNLRRGREEHTTTTKREKASSPPEGQSSICIDVVDWYDSDGPSYNCEWYGESMTTERCGEYGDKNGNFGYTASRACCVCGGGITYNVPSVFTEESQNNNNEEEKGNNSSYCAKIKVQNTNDFLHLNGLGDQLLSTRYPGADDDFTRFIFERQVNEASYRIRVKASGMYLREDNYGDRLLSTRTFPPLHDDGRSDLQEEEENENFTKFFLEYQKDDGTYKIRVKANGRYWYDDAKDSKLISTVSRVPQGEDAASVKFSLDKC